ncbi:MAG TPA: FxSxx-COOH system tetratricopeptide repeat protein [Pyrinomonadaceae bacterium]|nr:FxSxx-COOH system tetratricopeptide repeat protein [Pyrinomonadaceae bacterium]
MTEPENTTGIGSVNARKIKGPVTVNITNMVSDSPSPVVWNLPAAAHTLSGRDDELAQMTRFLETENPRRAMAIHGLSGVGKTQLAFAYAGKVRSDMRIGWLVPSATRLTATAALADLAGRLGLEDQDQETVARRVVSELCGRKNWLLVFDNASKDGDISDLIPDGAGQVLITSLEPHWHVVAQTLLIDPFDGTRGAEFLTARTGDNDHIAAAALTQDLGGLPLALEQAGAYCCQTAIRLADYRKLFKVNREQLLFQGAPEDYRLPVTVTWGLSFRRAGRRSIAAIQLLKVLAFLDPVGDPRDIIADVPGVPGELRTAMRDPLKYNEVIGVLVSLSLLTNDSETRTLRIHPLVQTILRDQIAHVTRLRFRRMRMLLGHATAKWTTRRWLACVANLLQGYGEPSPEERVARLLPHIAALAEHADNVAPLGGVIRLSEWTANYLFSRCELDAASEWQQRAVDMAQRLHGLHSDETLDLLMNLGNIYNAQGRLDEARLVNEKIVATREKKLHQYYDTYNDELKLLQAQTNLATTLDRQGELAAARTLTEEILAARIAMLGENHSHTIMSRNNLALALRGLGEYADAKHLLDRVIAEYTSKFGEDDLQTWIARSNLALVLRDRGDLEQARVLQEKVLDACRRIVGAEHIWTYKGMNNLAVILLRQGSVAEAATLLQETFAGRTHMLGTRHPDTQDTAAHLAEALVLQG